jgi:hypothetical protein
MSSNLLELPVRQARPEPTTPARLTRAQRRWIRRVLGVQLPRRRTAATVGSRGDRTAMKEAA